MEPIKVVVYGASGRMGQEVVRAVCQEPATQLVGAVELKVPGDSLALPDGSGAVPFSASLEDILERCRPDVVVDFTVAGATMPSVRLCAERGVNVVSGTTGLSAEDIKEIEGLAEARKIGVVVAPNFALGAVLLMHLAKTAGKYLDYAEIIELRLPGLMAHQEVILGGPGQTLSLRHDTINRECYMPGVMLAIKAVVSRKGLVYGLDKLLNL
jgi:4-hydroxy-tetrahydrodipicolinate reductase